MLRADISYYTDFTQITGEVYIFEVLVIPGLKSN